MMTISAVSLTPEQVDVHELDCDAVDYASIFAAEQRGEKSFDGCDMLPAFSIAFKPAPDMVIPVNLCVLHFNALKISLHEGVGVDEDMFGEFPNH